MDELPLFVFGTLRRGEENHHVLAGRFERVLVGRVPGFRRGVAAHGFPAILRATLDDEVIGELFFLDAAQRIETLRRCDELEDILPGTLAGEYYCRAKVRVETSEGTILAWAYVDPSWVADR